MESGFQTRAEQEAARAQNYTAFAALSLTYVRAEIAEALTQFGKFGLLEEYTKHDITHIDSMLKIYDWLVPDATAARMTAADWLLVTLSTYLHDFGLIITRDEYDSRKEISGFVSFASKVRDYDDPEYLDYRAQLDAMEESDAERFLYQEFVRANHAQRIRSWLRENPDPSLGHDKRVVDSLRSIFAGVEETFMDDLGLVCESHHADDLENTSIYRTDKPYGQDPQEEANVQYAAFLLRTADLLDITQSRVPSMSALVVNPRNPKSQLEWAKQRAVKRVRPQKTTGDDGEVLPNSEVIEVHAAFKESEGFFGLTQYLKYATEQVSMTHRWAVASEAAGAKGYSFPWRKLDTTNVVAKGFVAEPFEFTIDQGKILDLLTGHTLYNDSSVVVRELFQNSLDAVRLQEFNGTTAGFVPQIEIAWDSSERILSVADNGTGMTQSVIERNFLRVGSSRYHEAAFQKTHPDFTSISRFGIGVLSAFMVADDVQVITVNQDEPEARQLTLRDVHGQYLVRLLDKTNEQVPDLLRSHGTVVRVKLRPSASLLDVEAVLRYWCLRPGCSVTLNVDEKGPAIVGHDSMASALKDALLSSSLVRTIDDRLRDNFGDEIEIREVSTDGCEIAFAVVWSQWLQEWRFLRVEPERSGTRPTLSLGTAIGGVRVTDASPGFKSATGVAAMANVSGRNSPRTNVARNSIERTDEYEHYLDRVYGAYVGHINNEMINLEGSRSYSATRAAFEGAYLIQDIALERALESESRFRSNVTGSPFLVVEEGDERKRRSLNDIEHLDSVWTVEGTSIANIERVLGSVRGVSTVSLGALSKALGVSDSLQLPTGPLLCGLPSAWDYGGRLFADEWDPVSFETDGESRVLRALWKKNTGKSGWAEVRTPKDLPLFLRDRFDLADRMRVGSSTEVCVPVGVDAKATGIEESVIRCQGRNYVLPGSPFLDIEGASEDVPEQHRLWAIAFLIVNVISSRSNAGYQGLRIVGRVANDTNSRMNLLKAFKDYGIYEILDEASVMHAFGLGAAQLLDVDQWDRRSGGAE